MTWQQDLLLTQRSILENNNDPFYADKYFSDELHYWYHIPEYIALDSVKNNVYNVLDVGCGYGTLLLFAKNHYKCNVYGIDVSNKLGKLQNKININFTLCNIERDNPQFKVRFDRIIFTEVLEHLTTCPINILNKLTSMLSADGKMFLSTPNPTSPIPSKFNWGRNEKYFKHLGEFPREYSPTLRHNPDEHAYHYSEGELKFVIDKAGLKIDKMNIHQPPNWGSHFNMQLSKK